MKYLDYNYFNIPFVPYLKKINNQNNQNNNNIQNQLNKNMIDKLIEEKKNNEKYIVFNWHGNYNNKHELSNRGMNLNNAIQLFRLKNIKWIIITKEISHEEYQLLNTYNNNNNIIILNSNFDNNNIFQESIYLFQFVDYVISTDTSILHVAGTLDIPCIGLLTCGCDWRWGKDNTTNWYPNMKLIRQQFYSDWNQVINKLIFYISKT
jgi:ADP-heptose:LPS heptosyltransferase